MRFGANPELEQRAHNVPGYRHEVLVFDVDIVDLPSTPPAAMGYGIAETPTLCTEPRGGISVRNSCDKVLELDRLLLWSESAKYLLDEAQEQCCAGFPWQKIAWVRAEIFGQDVIHIRVAVIGSIVEEECRHHLYPDFVVWCNLLCRFMPHLEKD